MSKYIQFALIVVVCVALDQWTKQVASARLATTHGAFEHPIVLEVGDEDAGKTVEEVLTEEFAQNTPDEVAELSRRYVRTSTGTKLSADSALEAGDEIEVLYRKVTVIPDYFDLEYTRNPGAAFGIFSSSDSPYRVPFFLIVGVIAILVIIMMLRGVDRRNQMLIWALGLIAGGAIGNFIDRASYGWVIDFIVWKYGAEYRWPTFNLADAFICVGVGLLMLDMIIDTVRNRDGATDTGEE